MCIEYWNWVAATQRRGLVVGSRRILGQGPALTNSATSFALPLSDSLCTLDLSFSGASDAIFADVAVRFGRGIGGSLRERSWRGRV